MIDKVIIDGVNVSGCEFSTICSNELKCLADDKDVHICLKTMEKTKCPIYRLKTQLQRKIAECEELHTELKFKVEYIQEQVEIINQSNKRFEPFEDEYFKGLDTKQIAELAKKSIRLTTYNRKLEATLDEIEEIAAKNRNEFHFNNLIETVQTLNDFIKDFKQILDIISKAKGI